MKFFVIYVSMCKLLKMPSILNIGQHEQLEFIQNTFLLIYFVFQYSS